MRRRREGRASKAVTAGFLGGLTIGLVVWSVQIRRSRRDLFSRSPVRRLAALGYVGSRPGVESARLLGEYLRWETNAVLRRRGERMLRRMKVYLD